MGELKICRVCLITNVKGYSMNINILGLNYEQITGYKLNPQDGFPHWVCYECGALLHKYHKFKEKCIQGQKVLQRLLSFEPITYKGISLINRTAENLHSKLGIIVRHTHTKTVIAKHKEKINEEKHVEEVILFCDSEEEVKQEGKMEEEKMMDEKDEKDVKIKTEPATEIVDKHEEQPMDTHNIPNDNDVTYNNDADNDMADNDVIDNDAVMDVQNSSSDDENIFLDIVKKAVNGENQLIFLDNEVKEKITPKKKARKFMKRKKENLSMEYWKKYSLTEEEAIVEFKQRETSEKYLRANFQCHNCFKGFSKLDMLMRHIKMRHDESMGPLECRFCRMRFKQKCMLTKHMRQHYAVYHCLRCDMRFCLETSAVFHEDYHNGVIKKCKQCGEEFKHSSTFYTHMRMAHRSAHVCSACGVSFVSAAGLAQHARIKHLHDEHTENSTETTEKKIYCEKCDLKFVSQNAYDLHLSHSNLHAEGANDVQIKRRNMKGPMRRITKKAKKPTTCIHCGKHFNTQAACMKHHLSEHPRKTFYSPDQRHICEVCGASLAAVSIASHMNRHTREHVYPCDTCGMQFISKSSHHRHQVTHTGERPYPCPLCEKRFTQKNSMQLHYRTFHLKQPYPKRNRKRKTDEMPIMESCREPASDLISARWRITQ